MFVSYSNDTLINVRLAEVGTFSEMENTSKEDWIDVILIYVMDAW